MTKAETQFDNYGKPVGTILDDIKKGDEVQYIDTKNHFEGKVKKSVKIPLIGIWDGEEVHFNDEEKTVVRTIHWLTKVKKCPMCGQNIAG